MDALSQRTAVTVIRRVAKKTPVLLKSAGIKVRIKHGGDDIGQRDFVNACHRGAADLIDFVEMLHA